MTFLKRSPQSILLTCSLFTLIAGCQGPLEIDYSGPTADWPEFGSVAGGNQYSPLTQVNGENVERLEIAWEFHTGDVSDGEGEVESTTAFEATPIVVDETLYFCSPFNRVFALEPESGKQIWTYNPKIDLSGRYANQLVCRGVSYWQGSDGGGACETRIFTATNDARLIALDAASGKPCAAFGEAGEVDLTDGVGKIQWHGEYQITSAPTVAGDLVAVGSAVSDNARVDAPSGVVRAYDARTGELRWAWDPAPLDSDGESEAGSEPVARYRLGTPNVWGPMSFDAERDLLFAPTGNSAPDFYGGHRDGIDKYASSVVALRASTGEVAWSFATVHHDVWDYDVAAQPTLAEIEHNGEIVPAVIQGTKMGHVFVLHRDTGEPLFPVEERPVPQDGVPGEKLSPTQPFPVMPPPLGLRTLSGEDAWGLTPWDAGKCREKIEALRNDGPFTPPSLQGSLMLPGNAGGTNWGGVAVAPDQNVMVLNVLNIAFAVRLLPAEQYEQARQDNPGAEISPQRGTPYAVHRGMMNSPWDIPCVPPPWGTLAAVDLTTGEVRWETEFGSLRDFTPVPYPIELGTGNVAGPLVTGGGLIFIGALDNYLRAYDVQSGELLWKGRLPASAQANPMTYRLRESSKQFVVVAAGGHGRANTVLGDSLVAFALE